MIEPVIMHFFKTETGAVTTEAPAVGGGGGDNGESVILKPSFSYQCSAEGLFPHSSDCSKFWLCADEGRKELESQLYVCPDDYLVSYGPNRFKLLFLSLL